MMRERAEEMSRRGEVERSTSKGELEKRRAIEEEARS